MAKGGVGEVAVLGAPEGFRALVGELPGSVKLGSGVRGTTALGICFVRTRAELAALMELLGAQLPRAAHVWVLHPRAGRKPDFNQNDVRDEVLAVGLVDYEVCAVDEDWSGLKFAWRHR